MLWVVGLGTLSLSKGWVELFFLSLITPKLVLVFVLCLLWISLCCRLHSQGKRTLERNNVNYNGHMRKEHCMDYNQLTPSSMSVHMSMNSIKWPKKLKGELKLQGNCFRQMLISVLRTLVKKLKELFFIGMHKITVSIIFFMFSYDFYHKYFPLWIL